MNNDIIDFDAIVIGSGPAGCSASIYLARANISVAMISGNQKGGQLITTTDVENYPGFSNIVQGPELMDSMIKQSKNVGAHIINDHVYQVKSLENGFLLQGSNKKYNSKLIIIATGAQAKWLNLESENFFKGYGVSGCATCDGMFFGDQTVAVVGGGNTAVEEALYLTRHAKKVYLIHRRDILRAEQVLQKRLFDNNKIECIWNREVIDIKGETNPKHVKSVILSSTIGQSNVKIDVDGVFIAIGHKPNTKIFANLIDIDELGYIVVKEGTNTLTSRKGIFAAGDVHDKVYKQAITAAGYGCMAALDALKFLESI